MKIYWTKAAWVVLASSLFLAACKKNDKGELSGPTPEPTFTFTSKQVGLATRVYFTNTTQYSGPGIVQYEWDFGDGNTVNRATTDTISHVYTKGGTVPVQLLASARGGNGFSAKQNVVLPDVLTLVKQLLTNGSSKTWKLDNTATDPITVGPSDSDPRSYYPGGTTVPPGGLPACQADDEYTFSNANVFTYDAKAETFVANDDATNTPAHCDKPRSGTANYTYGAATGSGIAQITLGTPNSGGFRSTIGVTDTPDQIYRIVSIDATATHMVLKAGSASGSLVFQMKLIAK